jgi:hypothetical protein
MDRPDDSGGYPLGQACPLRAVPSARPLQPARTAEHVLPS